MDKPKESPTLKQANLQATASPRSNQSLQKSLLCQRREKNKKIFHASQKLNLPPHNLSLKLIDNQSNIDGVQRTTAYNIVYKTLGVRWLNQMFCPALAFVSADRYEARNPQRFIHATVISNNDTQLEER
ncbi:MAG: hypothetical protein ABIK31_04900 [candidate division WOR-3 bacterium]